jgi:tetratricopeptide (TPR) repeat protein
MAATPNSRETPATASPQERAAREFLAQGRFRKARDEFKLLCKIDRPKFLPLLVEANIGLAREMAGKGMVEEARQVLSYLKTIVSAEQLLGLELELGAGSATPGQTPDRPSAVPEVLRTLAKPALAAAERRHLADWAVLAFEPVPNPAPEAAAPAEELAAIVSALRAVSERQFDQALELLRPVGQASVFSHWKLFVKGMVAFHRGESERAARFFEGLPAGSAPAKASRSCLLLLGSQPVSRDSPLPSEAAIEWACRMAGERGLGGPLLRAEQAWRKDNPVQMYQNLRGGIPRFPGEGPDLIGVLSEFAVNCVFTLPPKEQDNYMFWMEDMIDGQSCKNPVELLLFLRARVLGSAADMPDEVAVENWEEFLRTREKLHGRNPALDSMACGWLGMLFSKPPERDAMLIFPFNPPRSNMRNAPEARRLLEKAVKLDEANLPASLCLCQVYKELGRHADRNRLLDRMTARFPAEKQVLMLAGQACLERKAYKRGLDYLGQALALDRLDPAIPDNLVKALLLQAREFFQKKRPDDARMAISQTDSYEVPTPGNMTRSRWCLRIQQGMTETIWGDPARGRALLEEARRESPSEAAFLYYAGLADMAIRPGSARGSAYFDEFVRVRKSGASAAEAVALTRIWVQGKEWLGERMSQQPWDLLDNYLRAAAKHPFAREDGSRLVEFCIAENDFAHAGMELVAKRLQQDPGDPLFRLYRLKSHEGVELRREEVRIELEEILAEAARRKEEQTARMARQQLDALRIPPPAPAEPFDDLPPEDEFDDEPLPDFGGVIPMLAQLLGGKQGKSLKVLEDLVNLFATTPERELKRMRNDRPPGMSLADFDILVEMARVKRESSNTGFPPGNFPPQPRSPGTIPPADSGQEELL